jgi:hypothetical protein
MTPNEKERQSRRISNRAKAALAARRKVVGHVGIFANFERNVPQKKYRPYQDYGRAK